MTRLQRLCLDAVERCGAPYLSTMSVYDYVGRRRWLVSLAGVHEALRVLEQLGYLISQTVEGGPERGGYPAIIYKRSVRIDAGETVPYTNLYPPLKYPTVKYVPRGQS